MLGVRALPAIATVCLAVMAASAPGGIAAAAQAIAGTARTALAAVVTSTGRPVVDLDLDDFVVAEGGQDREVLDAHVADYPLVVVVDDRWSAAEALPAVRRAAQRFMERVGDRPVALMALSGAGGPVATLTDGRQAALARLGTVTSVDGSVADVAPLEVIGAAGAMLHDSGAPFSAIVVIAAGPVDASAPVRGALLPTILESGAAVHVVQRRAAGPDGPAWAEADLLKVLADQTRGQHTPIFSSMSFDAALDRLADRLAVEMMVQYLVPPGPRAGDVRIGVRRPGARVVGLGVR